MPDFSQYALKSEMPAFTPFDPTGLQSQISALQNRQMFDPTGFQQRIGDLEGRQMFDPSGLKSRLSQLESQFQQQPSQQLSMSDIESLIEQRLSGLGLDDKPLGLATDPYDFKKDPMRENIYIGQPGDI